MDKQNFYEQQKAEIEQRYSVLRAEKKTRPQALEIMAKEFGLSTYTLKEIMSNSNYRKPAKKEESKIVPKSA